MGKFLPVGDAGAMCHIVSSTVGMYDTTTENLRELQVGAGGVSISCELVKGKLDVVNEQGTRVTLTEVHCCTSATEEVTSIVKLLAEDWTSISGKGDELIRRAMSNSVTTSHIMYCT